MNRVTAFEKLTEVSLNYSKTAKFSRVAPFVHLAVAASSKSLSNPWDKYSLGYIDAVLEVVETLAPKAEVDFLVHILFAAKALANPRVDILVCESYIEAIILEAKKFAYASGDTD